VLYRQCHNHIVASSRNLPSPLVTLYEPGLSDHHLHQWSVPVSQPDTQVVTVVRRLWHKFDVIKLSDALWQSQLCRPECSINCYLDELAVLYDSEPSSLYNSMVPVGDCHICGSTRNVASRNVQFNNSNVSPPVLIELRSLHQHGLRSVIFNVVYLEGRAIPCGSRRLTLKSLHPIICGIQSMCSWASVVFHPVTRSTPNSSMITLTPRSLVFDTQLMVLRRRPSQHHRLMSISPSSSRSPSTKWSLRSQCYLTRAVLLIHFRFQHSSPSLMFSHLF